MKALLKHKLWPIYLFIIAIIVYWPIINYFSPVNPDAQYIFPLLIKTNNLSEYIQNLFSLRTIDFQPLRDLSLYIDIFIYQQWDLNFSVLHNVILWVLGSFILGKIIKKVFPNLHNSEIFFIMVSFLVYPLFTQTVSWGIARKHILAFVFILLATDRWIGNDSRITVKNSIYVTFFYLLSVLSQPITLLWPMWAIIHKYFTDSSKINKTIISLIPCFLILIVVCYWNYAYYAKSPVFAQIYGTKTNEIFEFSDKILALGHYLFQMLFPYLLSFTYTLGHWSTLAGIILCGLITLLILRYEVNHRLIISWVVFIMLPLAIILTKSRTLYDTYLLVPSVGLLVILLALKEKLPTFRFKNLTYLLFIILWIGFSRYETIGWTNEIILTHKSFVRRPDCLSAFQFLRMSYENDTPPKSSEAKKFIYNHKCESFEISGQAMINLQSYLLYYEEDFAPQERINKLKNITSAGFLPNLALTALYIKLNRTGEADKTLKQIELIWGRTNFKNEYIPLVKKIIYPYCLKTQQISCLNLMQPFIVRPVGLFYK